MVSRVVGLAARSNANFGGLGQIVGTTTEFSSPSNLPVARRVRLHEQRTGLLVQQTRSSADGTYAFVGLRTDLQFYVVAFDHTGVYGGVVETDVTPEPMP